MEPHPRPEWGVRYILILRNVPFQMRLKSVTLTGPTLCIFTQSSLAVKNKLLEGQRAVQVYFCYDQVHLMQ